MGAYFGRAYKLWVFKEGIKNVLHFTEIEINKTPRVSKIKVNLLKLIHQFIITSSHHELHMYVCSVIFVYTLLGVCYVLYFFSYVHYKCELLPAVFGSKQF